MNLNHHPVNLRKGIVLGYCSSVSSVIRKLDAQENSVRKITGELANLLSSSSRSLRSDQTTKPRSLITKVLFRFTGIEILVCCYNPRRSLNEKTVDCFFYQTSRCKNGSFCRYRHGPEDDTIRDEMSLRRGAVLRTLGQSAPLFDTSRPRRLIERMWKRLDRSRRLREVELPGSFEISPQGI
ncbi:hypothetical protein NQ318_003161 [Aromia moschata]|uniref:C3H1-type domain-containing protein n=1 Tax=Aromia moschata TaxID=1265417 RepID=A0AAV8X6S2_9CUCU|nr:hypothetical protein NQ318_003161 [Aromia moschata]